MNSKTEAAVSHLAGIPLVTAHRISKNFGGVRALFEVDLELLSGQVLALLGENGAGKSTLISVLTGATAPSAGKIVLGSETFEKLTPADALRFGIAAIRQEPVLVSQLSIEENLLLGLEPRKFGVLNYRARETIARQWLDEIGSNLDPKTSVSLLKPADRQMVEVARAIGSGSKTILFDEPTACLTPREVDRLFGIIRSLSRMGVAIAYVSHRLDEVLEITTDVVVLRDGQRVAAGPTRTFSAHTLAEAMAGREISIAAPGERTSHSLNEDTLKIQSVSSGPLTNISLEVRKGEIHGIAGIVGSSRTRLANVVAGAIPLSAGKMILSGSEYRPKNPRKAILSGVGYVPEDRWRDSLFGDLSQATNILFSSIPNFFGFIASRNEIRVAQPHLDKLSVRPRRPRMLARLLSGGNQQKLIFGRALLNDPKLLVLDEPTRGVDVISKNDIHIAIRGVANRGAGVLMVSSDLLELMELSDRITVMDRGRTTATFEPPYSAGELIAAAAGGQDESQ